MSDEKMKILEMVESKTISVEEGLKLLSALEKIEDSRIITEDRKNDFKDEINDALSEINDVNEEIIEEIQDEMEEVKDELTDEIEEIVDEIENAYEDISESFNDDAEEAIRAKVDELKDKAEKIKEKVFIDIDMNGKKFKKEFTSADFSGIFGKEFKKEMNNFKRSFRGEMRSLGKEAKRFGREMSKLGKESASVTADVVSDVLNNINEMAFNGEFTESDFKMDPDAETRNYNLAQEFSIDPSGKNDVSIVVVSTDVTFVTEERDDILVNYIKYNPADEEKFQVVVEEDSKKIRITEKTDNNNKKIVFQSSGNRELLIRMPRKYKESLSVKTVSGDLDMNYLDSDFFRFSTVSGDLTADIIYSVNSLIKTTSGDCEIGLFRGNMMFSSVSGDIDLKYEKLDGDFTMKSISGDAELHLPKLSEFEVIAKTVSGDVDCDFPLTVIGTRKRGRLRGQVGSDAFTIAATTTSGDLDINKY